MEVIKLASTIRELADRGRVKAIVLRRDSPGGSAEAADYFAEAVSYAKTKKPVVVSMGQVAASGGSWAAMNASRILATPYTVTGSIGVIGSWFYDNGLAAKLGVSTDAILRGEHSDLLTGALLPYRDLSADEEQRYKSYIIDLYNVFVEKAAAGRGMNVEKVEANAQGRIFSGTGALEAGLIDSIGGLSDAIGIACSLAEIPEDSRVKYEEYPKPKFLERLLDSMPLSKALLNKSRSNSILSFADLLLPGIDIRYRLEKNGHVMPILPLEFTY
jgi:protease-4